MKTEHSRLNRWLYRVALSACVLTTVVLGLTQSTDHFDDAYITYRYAQNLATGHGFVYNPGEAVLGMTAPLYGLLLALIHTSGADIRLASHVLGVIGWAACAVLIERIGHSTGDRGLGLLAAALIASSAPFLQVIGLETNLMIAMSLGAMYAYLAGRTRLTFLLVALATWMRPDCALVAIVLAGATLWEKRALPWREGLIFVATLLPWLSFAQLFYGSIFPNSLYAKSGQALSLLSAGEWDTFGRGLIRLASSLYSVNKLYLLIGLLGLIGLIETVRRRPRWLIVVVWAGLYIVSYALLAVLPFFWYFLPVWPAMALLVARGINSVVSLLERLKPVARFNVIGSAALLGLILVPQLDVMWRSRAANPSPHYRSYVAIADWLRENTPPDASVAMIEIGIIGYFSNRRVVDTMGLVSPDMVGHLYGWDQTLAYALQHYWPDYAVALNGTAWDYVTQAGWFGDAYAPVAKIPSAGPGSRAATIYKRSAERPVRTFDFARSYNLTAGEAIGLSAICAHDAQLQPKGSLYIQIEWRAQQRIKHDDKVQIDLVNAQNGQRWTLAIEQPMQGGNPTFLWQPGEVVLDDYSLRLPSDLRTGPYLLQVELVDVTSDEWLDFADAQGRHIPHATAGPLWVGPAVLPPYQITTPLTATFNSIELLGFDLAQSTFAAGTSIPLTLYWQASRPVDKDYTVFVHVMDATGNLVAQQDNPPLQGDLPTSLWLPGIALQDKYQITLPAGLPAGEYTITIGLYRLDTGERLLPYSSAQVTDRALSLARITLR